MKLVAYLNFDGCCRAAFEFYRECLGGEIAAMFTFGETPAAEHVPAESRDKIMHARLAVEGQELMGSDCTPQHPYRGITGCSVSLVLNDLARAERAFRALAKGGQVQMPFGETFWAAGFGMAVDRFGVPWMVNCERPR
jgi:PhnB protein